MNIPVSFEFDGKKYVGYLSEVRGAGSDAGEWHLMVNNFYWGRLRKVKDEWFFDESKWAVGHLKDYFAAVVAAWYQ
jgi:hypothetical protein